MTTRQLRTLRGAAASSVAAIIAAVSHTVGGGAAPHPLLVIALSVFLTPLAAFLVGRRLNLLGLASAVALSQTIFHVLFVALGATAGQSSTASVHDHTITLSSLSAVGSADSGMLGAHVAAAVLSTAILWRGERMLAAIAGWVRAVLRRRMPQASMQRPARASSASAPSAPRGRAFSHEISPRGPPALLRG